MIPRVIFYNLDRVWKDRILRQLGFNEAAKDLLFLFKFTKDRLLSFISLSWLGSVKIIIDKEF